MSTEHDSNLDMADILIVDDESANLKLLSDILGREGYHVRPANSPRLAIDSALERPPDLMLLDVRMPEMDGFEVCASLKQDERTRDIPILFISALQDTKDKLRGFEVGGVDFISKPFQEEVVLARVRTHLKLRKMQRNLEELVAERTAELTRSEQLARSLLNATTDVTHLLDEDGTILELNNAMATLLGGTREELIGTCVYDIFPTEVAEVRREKTRQALVEGKSIRYIDRKHPDKVFDVGVYPIETSAGEKPQVVIFAHDITEHRRAEDALRASEKKLRESYEYLQSLTDALPDMVYSVSMPERRIAWVNANATTLGYDRDELIGRSTRFLYATEADFLRLTEELSRTIETGGSAFGVEVALKKKDGSVFPAEVTVSLFRIEGELANLIGIVRDISDRKSKELQIQIYQQHLKALAAKLTISEERERRRVATQLHDYVGQSLAIARLQLASAQRSSSDTTTLLLEEVSQTLLEAAQETRQLIFDLSTPAIKELGLQAALRDWLNERMPKHGIVAELMDHTESAEALPLTDDEVSLLFRHARELLTNVIKHAKADRVKVELAVADNEIHIAVQDNGVGFDAARASVNGKDKSHFGLLSIKESMADLGGSLEIDAAPDKGYRAVLRLPVIDKGSEIQG